MCPELRAGARPGARPGAMGAGLAQAPTTRWRVPAARPGGAGTAALAAFARPLPSSRQAALCRAAQTTSTGPTP